MTSQSNKTKPPHHYFCFLSVSTQLCLHSLPFLSLARGVSVKLSTHPMWHGMPTCEQREDGHSSLTDLEDTTGRPSQQSLQCRRETSLRVLAWECMHICMCMWAYVPIWRVHVWVCVHVCMHAWVYKCMCMCAHTCESVCIVVHVCVAVCACMYICSYVCFMGTCVNVCVHVQVCMYVWVGIHVWVCTCGHVYMCGWVCMHGWAVYTCVCVHARVNEKLKPHRPYFSKMGMRQLDLTVRFHFS